MSIRDVVNREMKNIEANAAQMGLEIMDIKCSNQRLEIICDRPGGGITLEECGIISRKVEDILDIHESEIAGHYDLDVSSPGLYRPLKKPEHFAKAVGARISIETDKPQDGRRRFTGILKEFAQEKLILSVEGVEEDIIISVSEVGKANLSPIINWK